jgi:hypothetical protein
MLTRQPNREDFTPWHMPIKANQWYDIVLGIHTSASPRGGSKRPIRAPYPAS